MQIFFKRDKRQWPPLPSPQDQSPTSPESLSSTRLLLFLLQINNNCSTRRQEWTFNPFHFTLVYVKLFEDWELKQKDENLPSPLPASSQYSGNDAVVFFSLEQVMENFRNKKKFEKNIFCAEKNLKKKQTNIISVALY